MRKNNKGFSLVELIVVIAIMAILAVTLAPRLVQYVERSRKAADGEVVNTIMTATRLGVLEEDIQVAFNTMLEDGTNEIDIVADGIYSADLAGKEFTKPDPGLDNRYAEQLYDIVGDFELKSNESNTDTTIKINYNETDETLTIGLYYDNAADAVAAYEVSDRYQK